MNKKIYIASPFGFSEAGRLFLYQVVETEIINAGYYVLDPWNITPPDLMEEALAMPYGTAKREKLREVNKIIGSIPKPSAWPMASWPCWMGWT
jgi:hypothetical protein